MIDLSGLVASVEEGAFPAALTDDLARPDPDRSPPPPASPYHGRNELECPCPPWSLMRNCHRSLRLPTQPATNWSSPRMTRSPRSAPSTDRRSTRATSTSNLQVALNDTLRTSDRIEILLLVKKMLNPATPMEIPGCRLNSKNRPNPNGNLIRKMRRDGAGAGTRGACALGGSGYAHGPA